ncbi:hypothetical protein EIN_025820 [Entamoeba invadens IP1]|uniref:hypothetical protein n=1 Tax=Entamoeba invadens IP1 TaxID=370355 RepID=UPI0002C3D870|nr:hypothetical protein EIN_025820 [Entamoeba invadens IP1]ELP90743.1 hypothetical protein EIN_025820 [Entamoeba invadens IP1]|eukprot:XP_004257514.1 hypothetical protein EIN_025820 [Entamoeba invadens IP1]
MFHFKLSQEESDHLEHYTIKTRDCSYVNNYINIPYLFNPTNKVIPKNIVPNFITLSGNVMPLLAFLTMTLLYPDYSKPLSPLMNLFIAFSIAWFWVADSVDGIRARSSGICSPIGDWLDHSLDNVTYFCFTAFIDHIFLCNSVAKEIMIIMFMVYTSYCVQIQAVYTNAIHLGQVNASCEGIMAFIGLVIFDIFVPMRDFSLFGIPAFDLVVPCLAGLLVIHTVVMVTGIKQNFPGNKDFVVESIILLFNCCVSLILGATFFYVFCKEQTLVNYIVTNLWIYACSLTYIDMVIQCRLFGRKKPSLFDLKHIIAVVIPFICIPFCTYTTAIVIGAFAAQVIMWTDWVATLLSMLDGLKLKLFQTEPTRFAPKKNTS